jgi:hypothetical protein
VLQFAYPYITASSWIRLPLRRLELYFKTGQWNMRPHPYPLILSFGRRIVYEVDKSSLNTWQINEITGLALLHKQIVSNFMVHFDRVPFELFITLNPSYYTVLCKAVLTFVPIGRTCVLYGTV